MNLTLINRNEEIFNKYHYEGVASTKLAEQYQLSREMIRLITNEEYQKRGITKRKKNISANYKKTGYIIEKVILEYLCYKNYKKEKMAQLLDINIGVLEKSFRFHKTSYKRLKLMMLGKRIYDLINQGVTYKEISKLTNLNTTAIYMKLLRYCSVAGREVLHVHQ